MQTKIILTTSTLIIVSLLVGAFYWFVSRPQEIRKRCYSEMSSLSVDITKPPNEASSSVFTSTLPPLSNVGQQILEGKKLITDKDKNNYYRSCLVKNGLKPESLYVNVN
ncbi:MAG: hypothetical protein Q7S45_03015 [Candidatus Curtissbacteria bacterium]|nr:hypothetical protein [Candidatus Curtissbacteria bacterium]